MRQPPQGHPPQGHGPMRPMGFPGGPQGPGALGPTRNANQWAQANMGPQGPGGLRPMNNVNQAHMEQRGPGAPGPMRNTNQVQVEVRGPGGPGPMWNANQGHMEPRGPGGPGPMRNEPPAPMRGPPHNSQVGLPLPPGMSKPASQSLFSVAPPGQRPGGGGPNLPAMAAAPPPQARPAQQSLLATLPVGSAHRPPPPNPGDQRPQNTSLIAGIKHSREQEPRHPVPSPPPSFPPGFAPPSAASGGGRGPNYDSGGPMAKKARPMPDSSPPGPPRGPAGPHGGPQPVPPPPSQAGGGPSRPLHPIVQDMRALLSDKMKGIAELCSRTGIVEMKPDMHGYPVTALANDMRMRFGRHLDLNAIGAATPLEAVTSHASDLVDLASGGKFMTCLPKPGQTYGGVQAPAKTFKTMDKALYTKVLARVSKRKMIASRFKLYVHSVKAVMRPLARLLAPSPPPIPLLSLNSLMLILILSPFLFRMLKRKGVEAQDDCQSPQALCALPQGRHETPGTMLKRKMIASRFKLYVHSLKAVMKPPDAQAVPVADGVDPFDWCIVSVAASRESALHSKVREASNQLTSKLAVPVMALVAEMTQEYGRMPDVPPAQVNEFRNFLAEQDMVQLLTSLGAKDPANPFVITRQGGAAPQQQGGPRPGQQGGTGALVIEAQLGDMKNLQLLCELWQMVHQALPAFHHKRVRAVGSKAEALGIHAGFTISWLRDDFKRNFSGKAEALGIHAGFTISWLRDDFKRNFSGRVLDTEQLGLADLLEVMQGELFRAVVVVDKAADKEEA
eukprot:gene17107-23409_t